jgi:hypothetical protein
MTVGRRHGETLGTRRVVAFAVAAILLGWCPAARGAVTAQAGKEAVKYVMKNFEKEAAEIGEEELTNRIKSLAARYGDDAVAAVRNVGPRGLKLAEEAGEQGGLAVKLMAKFGDDGAAILARPKELELVAKYGDDAASALARQKGIAEPLIRQFERPAVDALKNVGTQNARRLATMAEEGELTQIGRTPELLSVVGKYGDKAMDFIWKNKGALTVAAALTAFLADPQPFINGTRDLAQIAGNTMVKPLAEVPGRIAEHINWAWIGGAAIVLVGAYLALRLLLARRRAR